MMILSGQGATSVAPIASIRKAYDVNTVRRWIHRSAPNVRASVYSLHALGNPFGQFFAPIIAGLLAQYVFWQAPFIVFAVLQFPLYGIILGEAAERKRFRFALLILLAAHALAAAACFIPFNESFQ